MVVDIPPEILARVLEIGVNQWGIRYLSPVCLTCRDWNEIVVSNPRLWGIITIPAKLDSARRKLLDLQLAKAKAAPLTLSVRSGTKPRDAVARVLSLATNWVYADIPANLLGLTSGDLPNLQVLRLRNRESTPDSFSNEHPPSLSNLRSFAAYKVPARWIFSILNSAITSLELSSQSWQISQTLRMLTQVPNLVSLQLTAISCQEVSPNTDTDIVSLEHLTRLEVSSVTDVSRLLNSIRAPALHSVSIRDCRVPATDHDSLPLRVLFLQWGLSSFIPAHLHTLEIQESLVEGDAPFLGQWLKRLTSLNRLILADVELERSILTVLASSNPLLTQLFIEMEDLDLEDLIAIAQARCTAYARLSVLQSVLCSSGSSEQLKELSCLVGELHCGCLGCSMK